MSLRVEHVGRSVSQYPGVGYAVSVIRHSDNLSLDWDDLEWKSSAWVSPRADMSESATSPGLWLFLEDLPADFTGAVTVCVHRTPELSFESRREVYIVDGEALIDVARSAVLVDSDTGGVDALTFVDSNGDPIGDAIVRAFLTSEYDDPPDDGPTPLYITTTDARGRMRDRFPLTTGESYTIQWEKSGVAGPVSTTLDV